MSTNGGGMTRWDKKMIRSALYMIISTLPDNNVEPQTVVVQALKVVVDLRMDYKKARRLILRLVADSPRCFGTRRKKRYWKIVRSYFTDPVALDAYLRHFPDQLTDAQYNDIVRYINELNFDSALITMALRRRSFVFRDNELIDASRARHIIDRRYSVP